MRSVSYEMGRSKNMDGSANPLRFTMSTTLFTLKIQCEKGFCFIEMIAMPPLTTNSRIRFESISMTANSHRGVFVYRREPFINCD